MKIVKQIISIRLIPFLFSALILLPFFNLKAAEDIEVDQSYLIEVENRKAVVLEVEKTIEIIEQEIVGLEKEREQRQQSVNQQQTNIDIKEEAVNAQKEVLQEKLSDLLAEESKKSQLEQEVLRKDTEIDAKKVELAEKLQDLEQKKELVDQANADISRQKQLITEQRQAEQREIKKRELLKQLEGLRTELNELGVSFTGAITNSGAGQSRAERETVNSKLKQCERNVNLVDNRDGTISDRSTKLMWQKCSLGEKYDADTNLCMLYAMASNGFNINERLRLFNREQEFLNRYSRDRGGSSYYSDWRIPSITEIKTLLKEPCAQDPTYYHSSVFEATKEDRYITGSLNNSGESLFLDFKSGQIKTDISESSGYVRLVR